LRKQGRSLASEQEVEKPSRPGRHISFESHKFLIRPNLGSKTTILGLKKPISGMYINRYQNDTLARPQSRLSHARQQLEFRGATEQQVIDTIRSETWEPAKHGRSGCRKNFVFNSEWNKKYYSTKQIRPIFVDEPDEIVVVTIYVYYF
jgi:hypothetical protein